MQYLRPDGHTRTITIDRPPDVEGIAQELLAHGYGFEAEVLLTGEISLEVVGPENGGGDRETAAIEVVPNGPAVPAAVDVIVRKAQLHLLGAR